MKKCLLLITLLALTTIFSAPSFAAIHSSEGDPFKTDTFYSITPASPYMQASYGSQKPENNILNKANVELIEYYRNDQTFVTLGQAKSNYDYNDYTLTTFKGSYLFKSNWFIGLGYQDQNFEPSYFDTYDAYQTMVSPGYRFSFDENSYLAFSVDYKFTDNSDDIYRYDLDLKYYQDRYKISGNIMHYKDSYTYAEIGAVYQFSETFAAGFDIWDYSIDDMKYKSGFTWKVNPFILDLIYGDGDSSDYSLTLNGMCYFNDNFAAGLKVQDQKSYDDLYYAAIFKYTNGNANFKLFYSPDHDGYPEEIGLSYFKTF